MKEVDRSFQTLEQDDSSATMACGWLNRAFNRKGQVHPSLSKLYFWPVNPPSRFIVALQLWERKLDGRNGAI